MIECIKHSLNYNFLVIKAKDMFQCENDNEFIIEGNMIYKSLTDPKISKRIKSILFFLKSYKYNIKSTLFFSHKRSHAF